MAKSGSQIHAILACVKFRKDKGRTVRNCEFLRLWPSIGMSTLPNLLGGKGFSGGRLHNASPKAKAFLERVATGVYTITAVGEKELDRLGPYTIEMWNHNAPAGTLMPWEQNWHGDFEIQTPKPLETGLLEQFLVQKVIASGALQFFRELREKNDWETCTDSCKNPECGNRRQDVKRLYQDPKFESAVLRVTILTCRLCGNEHLAGMEDVPVADVPELEGL